MGELAQYYYTLLSHLSQDTNRTINLAKDCAFCQLKSLVRYAII